DVYYRRRQGEQPRPDDYTVLFPAISFRWLESVVAGHVPVLLDRTAPLPAGLSALSPPEAPRYEQLQRIGRYRVERLLGHGGFGQVYLAQDDQLDRLVTVKVPHRHLVSRFEDAEPYLLEARIVAKLDHPHIVPVFDVGSTEECPFFFVSKYIEGH